jgi:hypothetical protein
LFYKKISKDVPSLDSGYWFRLFQSRSKYFIYWKSFQSKVSSFKI